jgi:hypothetical protein
MAEAINGVNSGQRSLHRNEKTPRDLLASFQGFSLPPGWAKSNPDLALTLLFIFPKDDPWVSEILGQN